MKINIYDFDDTIYHGSSPLHFFIFCFKKKLIPIRHLLKIPFKYLNYLLSDTTYTELHEFMMSPIKDIPNLEELILKFWKKHKKNIKPFYLKKEDKSKDIIISASPYYLIKPIADELGVKDLIASDIDIMTGLYSRNICMGEEKVVEFRKKYPKESIIEAYGNSKHDLPYMKLARHAYLIKGFKIYELEKYRPNIFKRFWNWGWSIYHLSEELWNYLIAGGLTTVISVGTFAIFTKSFNMFFVYANVLSWVFAVIFAYYINRIFVFKSKTKKKLQEFMKFTAARVLSLLLDTALMILLVGFILVDELVAKVIVSAFVIIANYGISKYFIFKSPK